MGGKGSKNTVVNSNRITLSNENLDSSLEKFWKIDSFGTLNNDDPALLPRNEQKALNILEKTVKRIDSHYSVGLLWKEESPSLPNNRNLALSRLLSLEKKFKNNPKFHAKYQKTVNEYISKGNPSKIVGEDLQKHTSKVVNYIPHHRVTNVNKPDKVRVVFDAGATYNSTSLDQNLLKGPDLLNSLVGILIRFRVGRFAVMGDIEQMFHQILVENEHRDALRFLWRNNFNDPIDDYRTYICLAKLILHVSQIGP